MRRSVSDVSRCAPTIVASVRIPLDDPLLEISCRALDDICRQYGKENHDDALKNREIDQMHDALMLIRSGILSFDATDEEHENRSVTINIKICNYSGMS